jgi:hypothetical protein
MGDIVVAGVIRIQDGGILLLLLRVIRTCVVLRITRMPGSIKQLFNMLLQNCNSSHNFLLFGKLRKLFTDVSYLKVQLLVNAYQLLTVTLAINKLHDKVESLLNHFSDPLHAASKLVQLAGIHSCLYASDLLDDLADGVGRLSRLSLHCFHRLFHANLYLLNLVHLSLEVPDDFWTGQVLA